MTSLRETVEKILLPYPIRQPARSCEFAFAVNVDVFQNYFCRIDLYHAMLKQKILHGYPLIQCEARRAKTKLFVPLGLKMAAA